MASWRSPDSTLETPGLDFKEFWGHFCEIFADLGECFFQVSLPRIPTAMHPAKNATNAKKAKKANQLRFQRWGRPGRSVLLQFFACFSHFGCISSHHDIFYRFVRFLSFFGSWVTIKSHKSRAWQDWSTLPQGATYKNTDEGGLFVFCICSLGSRKMPTRSWAPSLRLLLPGFFIDFNAC